MTHVVSHVRRHVTRRMGMVRWITSLGRVKVMVLLRRGFPGCSGSLDTDVAATRATSANGFGGSRRTTRRQLYTETGEMVRMRRYTVQKGVHHRGVYVRGEIQMLSCANELSRVTIATRRC